jgi:hypothetical protein
MAVGKSLNRFPLSLDVIAVLMSLATKDGRYIDAVMTFLFRRTRTCCCLERDLIEPNLIPVGYQNNGHYTTLPAPSSKAMKLLLPPLCVRR